MCGIAGYIGQSTKPKLTYELITSLFDYLELRGTDASGVWGTELGEQGRVVYHKEPIRSSDFIKTLFWQKLRNIRTDMLLVHARATSSKGAHANCNTNNHPFVSLDCRIGMIHNGTIEEADFLKDKYQTVSETDSECLLRIFEHGLDNEKHHIENVPDEVSSRMSGIRDIWSYISTGAMAVALGERVDDYSRNLFLFRNDKRPLWMADLRGMLGQIFFFSSPDIWYRAISNCPELKKQCWNSQKLIELPNNQAWYFGITKEDPVVDEKNFFRFKLQSYSIGVEFQKGELLELKPPKDKIDVFTHMEDNEELANSKEESLTIIEELGQEEQLWQDYEKDNEPTELIDWGGNCPVKRTDHEELCKKIIQITESINTGVENLCMEGSMSSHDYTQLLESLEQTKCDLEGTLALLG